MFMPLCRGETSSAHHRTAPRQTGCDWIDSNRRKRCFLLSSPGKGLYYLKLRKSCCVFLLPQNLKAYEISNFQSQEPMTPQYSFMTFARRRQLKTSHWQVTGPASDSAEKTTFLETVVKIGRPSNMSGKANNISI